MAQYRPWEYIDRAEGDDDFTDEDEQLTVNQKQASIQQLAADLSDVETTDEDDAVHSNLKSTTLHEDDDVRLTSSEDERPESPSLASSSKQKRKATMNGRIPSKKRIKVQDRIVGTRQVKSAPKIQKNHLTREATGMSSDESDEDAFADNIPEYIKQRRSAFEADRQRLNNAGLKLPPRWQDIEFSEDGDDLPERPTHIKVKPQAPYEHATLKYSAGIVPPPIAQHLRGYQVEGAEFMHELFVYQKGGLLADDMGLGKTIQVIVFLTAAYGKSGDVRDNRRMRKIRRMPGKRWYPRTLIICPGSLMNNWKAELDRWGWWHIGFYHSVSGDKDAVLEAAMSGHLEIMITTYTTYTNHVNEVNAVPWDCVIADEVHNIKNRGAKTYKAMNQVNALARIGLSGTTIQNNYDELWALLNWTNPGEFGVISAWKQTISKPLQIGQSHGCSNRELRIARTTASKLVKNLLPPFFLRRTKKLIAHQLPIKKDRAVFCPLTGRQADAYQTFADSKIIHLIRTSTQSCECGSGKKRGWCCYKTTESGTPWQNLVFPCIATLQKLSNHLALIVPSSEDDKDRQAKDLITLQSIFPTSWRSLYQHRNEVINYADPENCGKWKVLRKLLRFWYDAGDKVLVFSHSVRLLKMFRLLFSSATSYNVSYLDGKMSLDDRTKAVDEFNTDPKQFVFLISTKAGGVGLNITAANKVVIVDPNWNPSYDLQAADRAYRIGQTRDVEVFRLISAGTIEEIVYARQIYKQQQANIGYTAQKERRLFEGVQNNKDRKGELFGLANLFSFHGEQMVLRDIIAKTEVAEMRAGVSVVGLDFDSGQDEALEDLFKPQAAERKEDEAMSQLAAFISQGDEDVPPKRDQQATSDPVSAILASAGVTYSHRNDEVIGESKIESKLSRRAEEAGHNLGIGDQQVFPDARSDDDHEEDLPQRPILDGENAANTTKPKCQYRPPLDVMQRQFVSMAKFFNCDVVEFALQIEAFSAGERRRALEQFYEHLGLDADETHET